MKRLVLSLLLVASLAACFAQSAEAAYYRRPLLRRGLAAVARVGIGYGMSRAYGGYGYGYPYGYRGFYPGYGYGYRPGFGIGFY
ncbi:MAG: hypothetical protein QM775_27040 [Pirellulales bacterium]